MKKLKYTFKVVKTRKIEETLNEQSKLGWEFVGFTPFMNHGVFGAIEIIFKRAKQ